MFLNFVCYLFVRTLILVNIPKLPWNFSMLLIFTIVCSELKMKYAALIVHLLVHTKKKKSVTMQRMREIASGAFFLCYSISVIMRLTYITVMDYSLLFPEYTIGSIYNYFTQRTKCFLLRLWKNHFHCNLKMLGSDYGWLRRFYWMKTRGLVSYQNQSWSQLKLVYKKKQQLTHLRPLCTVWHWVQSFFYKPYKNNLS